MTTGSSLQTEMTPQAALRPAVSLYILPLQLELQQQLLMGRNLPIAQLPSQAQFMLIHLPTELSIYGLALNAVRTDSLQTPIAPLKIMTRKSTEGVAGPSHPVEAECRELIPTRKRDSKDSAGAGLQLLDMPEQVLKHISRSISARRWAIGPALTCGTLNRLSLPVIKVRHSKDPNRDTNLSEIFTWIGKRMKDTVHLAIHIDYPLWERQRASCTAKDLLRRLFSAGYGFNANMKTLDLTIGDWFFKFPEAALMGWLQDEVMACCSRLETVSMSLEKAPAWLMKGSFLRQICLYFPAYQTSDGLFAELSGFHSRNLPNLQTLFLQGSPRNLRLNDISFQESQKLEVVHLQDLWVEDLLLPPSCKVCVSAQSSSFIVSMDESREHPLVSKASRVSLPIDLAITVVPKGYLDDDNDEEETAQLQRSAMGIPNMFPAMRSLCLTQPHGAFRPLYRSFKDGYIYEQCLRGDFAAKYQDDCAMSLVPLECFSGQWRHTNLKELVIEGHNLLVTVPMLPNLETLLVACSGNVSLDFKDPQYLGRTITRMIIRGDQIHFHKKQKLLKALEARRMGLVGEWNICIAIHASSEPVPSMPQLLRQAFRESRCTCGPCPYCLGIGLERLETNDPAKGRWH